MKGGGGALGTHQLFCAPPVSRLQFDTPCGCKAAQGLELTGWSHSPRRPTGRGLSITACQTARRNMAAILLVDFRLPVLSVHRFTDFCQSPGEYQTTSVRCLRSAVWVTALPADDCTDTRSLCIHMTLLPVALRDPLPCRMAPQAPRLQQRIGVQTPSHSQLTGSQD